MAKKKSNFNSWDEVAVALRDMRDIELRRRKAVIAMNNAITAIKDKFQSADNDEAAAYAELADDVKAFVKQHKSEFSENRSRDLTFGTVGFRKSTEIITRNVKAIIEAAKLHRMNDCVSVTEKLDKTALGKYDDAALKAIGARRQEKDVYFCDLNIEELEG